MLKILILEDEEYTLRFLEKLVSEHPLTGEISGTSSGSEAIQLAGKISPDIAFLDIELTPQDELNGIEVARTIQRISPHTKFVFVTGYTRYAIDSFVVHPYDYVLKPIQKSKVFDILSELSKDAASPQVNTNTNRRLIFRSEDEIFFINTADVFFFEKMGKKAAIHSSSGVREATCIFNELETLLGSKFIRVHKSYVVNMDKISRIIDTGNQSYEVYFHDYDKVALLSRIKYREHQDRFTPSL